MSLLRNVPGAAHVWDSAAFGSVSFGCVLDQVMLGAGEGVCAQVAFLLAESTCCSLSLLRCCPQSSCLKILYLDVVKSVAAPWRGLAGALCQNKAAPNLQIKG